MPGGTFIRPLPMTTKRNRVINGLVGVFAGCFVLFFVNAALKASYGNQTLFMVGGYSFGVILVAAGLYVALFYTPKTPD
ncbi:MAG: hypothetical protein KGH66_04000 [Candidatus Micrarchaeota archaeon]|nr:hypothetical protein [Candidatus Micrarchaeota archaeon]